MMPRSSVRTLSFLHSFARAAAWLVIGMGLAGVAGWIFDISFLKSILDDSASMKFNTAAGVLCAGMSLWCLLDAKEGSKRKGIGQFLAILVLILGSLSLSEYLFGWNLGFDRFFVQNLPSYSSAFPERMSAVTAICFILTGAGLLLLENRLHQWLMLCAAILAFLALLGYLYDYRLLYQVPGYGSIALNTALSLLLIALGTLAARPRMGVMQLVTSTRITGRTLRFLLPAAILMIVILGFVVERGEQLGVIDSRHESELLVVLLILIYSPLIYFYAQRMNTAELEIVRLNRLYATLSQVNQMMVRVRDRKELYQSICDISVHFGQFSLAWIGLLEEVSGTIRPVAANGLDARQWPFPMINIQEDDIHNSLIAGAMHTSHVVTSEDVQMDPRTKRQHIEFQKYDYHSSAAVPFQLRGRTIGVVSLVSNEVGFFTSEREIQLLTEMGRDVSFVLDSMESDEQLRFYASIVTSASDAIIGKTLDGIIVSWNAGAERLYGYTAEEIIGKHIEIIVPPDRPDDLSFILDCIKRGQCVSNYETVRLAKDGRMIDVSLTISPILDERNQVVCASSICHDISERKRAEEKIAFQAHLLENVNDAVLSVDTGLKITSWNRAAEEMYGYKADEVLGHSAREIIRSEFNDVQRATAIRELSESGSYRVELRQSHRNGHPFWVEGSTFVIRDAAGQTDGYISINRDISQRKLAEEHIRRQFRYLNALRLIDTAISSSFDLSIVLEVVLQQVLAQLEVDASALLLFDPVSQSLEYAASQGFRSPALQHTKLKLGEGFASQAVLEKKTVHITNLMDTGSKLTKALQTAHEEFMEYYGTPLTVKGELKGLLEIYHRSPLKVDSQWLEFLEALGGQAAIAINDAQLFDHLQRSNAELEQRVAARTAELTQTNAELEHANRAKDEFLATMSHELRTPLSSILGLSESLLEERRGTLNEQQQKSLEIIEASGSHLLQLINDILDLSKIDAGKFDYYPQPISVTDICISSLSLIKPQAARKSIHVEYINDEATLQICADPRRLKQILVNLLTNAVKFTLEQCHVTLQVNTDVEEDLVQFAVIDDGIGIAAEDFPRLFQPFVQLDSRLNRQHQGTGLGLALVQKLVDLHGGSISVESEVGKGSRFTVNLPINQEEISKLEEPRARVRPGIKTEDIKSARTPSVQQVILLAEDNMANILTIGEYLESHGYQVEIAHDGMEALEKADLVHPAIILMDIQMPVMDGLQAIARLRQNERHKTTPVIALTALAMPGDRERCLLAGADVYISKPVPLKTLLQMIGDLLDTAG